VKAVLPDCMVVCRLPRLCFMASDCGFGGDTQQPNVLHFDQGETKRVEKRQANRVC